MRTKNMPASELVIDFNLYPRHHVDRTNVRAIKEAMSAGEDLPAVVADAASLRVIDGVHRVTGALELDENATIKVALIEYDDEAAMFLDAVRRNARHGVKLSSYDRARVVHVAERLGIDEEAVAGALATTVDVTARIKAARTAYDKDTGKPVQIKRAARHLAGSKLSKKQQRANQRSQGWPLYFHCEQIINAIEGDLVDWTDERNTEALARLRAAIAQSAAA